MPSQGTSNLNLLISEGIPPDAENGEGTALDKLQSYN